MTTLPRLALLASVLLSACSDDDSLPRPEVTYSVSYKDATTIQPRILEREVRLDEGPVVKQKLAFGSGELDAGPVDGGYQISVLDPGGVAHLRLLCKKSKNSNGNQTTSATLPDGGTYSLAIIEDGAECDPVP
jgi:hypothetical protein